MKQGVQNRSSGTLVATTSLASGIDTFSLRVAWSSLRHSAVRSRTFVFIAFVLSFLAHIYSVKELAYFGKWQDRTRSEADEVSFKPLDKETAERMIKQVVEVKQKTTAPPVDDAYLSQQNHRAEKQTKLSQNTPRLRTEELGQTSQKAMPKAQVAKPQQVKTLPNTGNLSFAVPKDNYSNLMPTAKELMKQMDRGYVGYVADQMDEGDAVDINTTEYRFLGYFTNMRKAIELVWTYPYEAAVRGMQGNVGLMFTILKDGRVEKVKVISTSGYKVLDQAVVEAINNAAPFAPLPDAIKKDRLPVKGNFTYTLSGSGN
jgi:protein TonB